MWERKGKRREKKSGKGKTAVCGVVENVARRHE